MKTIDRHYQIIEVKQIVNKEFKEEIKRTGSKWASIEYTNNDGYKKEFSLIGKPSNLGKGLCWFFVCPITGNTCRKMYYTLQYGYVSRGVINAPYHQQTLSKLDRQFKLLMEPDKLREKLEAKNFKYQYNGIPTKKYMYLLNKLEQATKKEQAFLRVLSGSIGAK